MKASRRNYEQSTLTLVHNYQTPLIHSAQNPANNQFTFSIDNWMGNCDIYQSYQSIEYHHDCSMIPFIQNIQIYHLSNLSVHFIIIDDISSDRVGAVNKYNM